MTALTANSPHSPRHLALPVAVCVTVLTAMAAIFAGGMTAGNLVGLYIVTLGAIVGTLYVPFSSRGFTWVIAIAATLLGAGIILNCWYYTTGLGGTPEHPVLINWDMVRWWQSALWTLGLDGPPDQFQHLMYCHLLGGLLSVFGTTVAVPMIFNVLLSLSALYLCALTAYKLTANRTTACIAAGCTAAVCYWLAMGTLILKEPLIFSGIILAAYGLVSGRRTMAAAITGAAAILAVARPNSIFFVIIGLLFVPELKKHLTLRIALIVVCMLIWYAANQLFFNSNVEHVISADYRTCIVYSDAQRKPLYALLGEYTELPWYTKVAALPVTILAQFLIPFPWNFERDLPYGLTEVWAHITYPWYIFGAILIFYLATRLWRRDTGRLMRLTLWGVIMWVIPCYLFSGTISRYGLPSVAIMAPAVAVTLQKYYKNRRFYTYLAIFAVIMLVGLLICHHIQMMYVQ